MFKAPSYVIISAIFFIIIGVVFAYSYFFYPNNHPLTCVYKMYTSRDCPACGFSRAFSYYTHFKFEAGKMFNKQSWPVFLFFCSQFFLRAAIIIYFIRTHKMPTQNFIKTELVISISGFLLAFLPLILTI